MPSQKSIVGFLIRHSNQPKGSITKSQFTKSKKVKKLDPKSPASGEAGQLTVANIHFLAYRYFK
ncbi:hypothetical protein [Algoriphagus chordae]|uniref:hypothetical protein n=1 Tax=Algoriphagus chordae TaxID=237019 RepID=UPI000DAB5077|nr:hypothetical protein [Algoriphagus chordae]